MALQNYFADLQIIKSKHGRSDPYNVLLYFTELLHYSQRHVLLFYFQTPNLNLLNAPQVGSGNVGRPAMPVLPLPLPAKGLPQPLPVGAGHAGMPQVNPMPSKPPGHYPPPPGMLAIKFSSVFRQSRYFGNIENYILL